MSSTTTLDLLKEIILHPGDDTLRLAYADALDEESNEETLKSRFIRLSVAVAAGARQKWKLIGVWDKFRAIPAAKTRETTYFPRWCVELTPTPRQGYWGKWSRGFVEELVVKDTRELVLLGLYLLRRRYQIFAPTTQPVKKVVVLRAGVTSGDEEKARRDLEYEYPGVEFDLRYSLRSVPAPSYT